jgi:hypothetical protein
MRDFQLPLAFEFEGENVPKLAKFKRVRAGKWSLRSAKSLSEIAELATYLLALERYEEAAEIGQFVSEGIEFSGNYDLWSPASQSIAIGARASRMLGQEDRASKIFAPLKTNPSHCFNQATLKQILRETYDSLRQGVSLKLIACHNALVLEEFYAGRGGTEWYPITELEAQLNQALALIRQSLEPRRSNPDYSHP